MIAPFQVPRSLKFECIEPRSRHDSHPQPRQSACDPRDRDDRQIKRYPKLIVEVLSPGTQSFDRADKFDDYCQLDSLEEYVLIDQEQPAIKIRRRQLDRTWQTETYGPGDLVPLRSIDLDLAIGDLYRGLD